MAGNVLVFVEQQSGRIHQASLQMFTLGQLLINETGGELHAVIVGEDLDAAANTIRQYGPTTIHLVDHPELRYHRALPYTRAVCSAVAEAQAEIVLMVSTCLSRDLAPRITARLGASLATDCCDVRWEDSQLRVRRPMYCAKCI